MTAKFLETSQFEIGLNAVADAFADDTAVSDVVSLKHHNRVVFITHWGVGTTGVIKLTVQACDDVVPTTTSAVPFHYRINKAGVHGALTGQATAATGVSNVAGSNQIIAVEIEAEKLLAAGYSYARLAVEEVTDSPLLGGIIVLMLEPRNSADTPTSALT